MGQPSGCPIVRVMKTYQYPNRELLDEAMKTSQESFENSLAAHQGEEYLGFIHSEEQVAMIWQDHYKQLLAPIRTGLRVWQFIGGGEEPDPLDIPF